MPIAYPILLLVAGAALLLTGCQDKSADLGPELLMELSATQAEVITLTGIIGVLGVSVVILAAALALFLVYRRKQGGT